MPIYLDIRPWGSMSTIVAHTYFSMGRRPSKTIAGMLLCAILSDTLNLLGPTTTEWDKMIVALLQSPLFDHDARHQRSAEVLQKDPTSTRGAL